MNRGVPDFDEGAKLKPRKMPVQNIAHRLMAREMFGTSGCRFRQTGGGNTTRSFYLNVVPNFTLMNVVFHPPCFLRKFSPDGRHLIAFSTCQRFLEIYRFKGCSAASELIHEATTCSVTETPPPPPQSTQGASGGGPATRGGVSITPAQSAASSSNASMQGFILLTRFA